MPTISRDAQIVAQGLFGRLGSKVRATFHCPHIIHPRARAALDELTAAGMLVAVDPNELPAGRLAWAATDKIGKPLTDYPLMTEAESFPITNPQ